MHPTTVQGREGLAAMRTLLKVYFDHHGIAIHFNIFDANVLLDAQKHPEKIRGFAGSGLRLERPLQRTHREKRTGSVYQNAR